MEIGFIDFHISAACLMRCGSRGNLLRVRPALFVLGWTGVIKRGVHAAAVVPAQPLKHRVLGFADSGEALPIEPLHFQRSEQRLRAGVVQQLPLRLIEAVMPCRSRSRAKSWLAY